MIQISPRIYAGETIYSIASRIVLNDVASSVSQSMLNVFDSKNIQLNSILPSYLNQLSSLTSCTVDYLIDNHTLFEYYSAFSPDRIKKQARDFLKKGDSSAAFKALGLLANRISDKEVHKYCPVCALEQEFLFGEAFWLLDQQLPLSLACIKHECMLEAKTKARKQLIFPDVDSAAVRCTTPLLFKIAELNSYIVNGYSFDPVRLNQVYAVRLINRGFATTKAVKHIKWRNEMRVYFSSLMNNEQVRKLLESSSKNGFPANIFYHDDSSHHPIKHVLIISFLFEHFGDFIVAYSQGESLLASKVKPATPQANIDVERHSKTLKLLKSGMSLRDVIRHANVSAATVRIVASKHGIALHENSRKVSNSMRRAILVQLMIGKSTQMLAEAFNLSIGDIEQALIGQTLIKTLRQRIRFYNHRRAARQAVTSALYTLVRPSISKLRKKVDKEYMWLYRHDRRWLNDFKNTYFDKQVRE